VLTLLLRATSQSYGDTQIFACHSSKTPEPIDIKFEVGDYVGDFTLTSKLTRASAMAEGPRDVLVSRNSATTKYPYRMALFA